MSDTEEFIRDLDERLSRAGVELQQRLAGPEAVKAEAMARSQAQAERDEAAYPERCRAQRHHDVLCLVLKELVRSNEKLTPHGDWTDAGIEAATTEARKFADLAYPPPKAEP